MSPVPARVLIVDDSVGARTKLALAVTALGHVAIESDGGADAIERVQHARFDLVLLDIMMPDVDGFEVLRYLKCHESLCDVPVLVVSGLENDPGSVIEAIRLGAIDFLPKAFESVLLNARVNAALGRKRDRDAELATIAEVDRLTRAAELLEQSLLDQAHLGLDDLARRDDPLGHFAATFGRLADLLCARRRRLQRRLAMQRGLALMIVSGVLFGLTAPLSKIASTETPNAMGLSLWTNALAAALCLSITVWRRRWPMLDAATIRFLLWWSVIGAVFAEVMLFYAARLLDASTLSIIIVLESFFVFALSALARQERATFRRLIGLSVGLAGTLLVLGTGSSGGFAHPELWLLIALTVPLAYALEDLLIAHRMPETLDLTAAIGLVSLIGMLLLAPLVWWFDDAVSPLQIGQPAILAVFGIVVVSVIGNALNVRLIGSAGAVFGSQTSYVITIAGIVWAMLLLGERPGAGLWGALLLLFVGLLLVEPRRDPDETLGVGVFGGEVSRRVGD